VKVEVHADLQAFDEARWNGLLDRARLPSVFLTWQWQTEWSRAFAADRPQQILTATDADGSLAGVLPLYEDEPGRQRIIGGVDVSDYLDLIAVAGREEEIWQALLHHRAGHDGLILFVDQLEELVTVGDPAEVAAFDAALARLSEGVTGVRLIANLTSTPQPFAPPSTDWRVLIDSEDPRYAGQATRPLAPYQAILYEVTQ